MAGLGIVVWRLEMRVVSSFAISISWPSLMGTLIITRPFTMSVMMVIMMAFAGFVPVFMIFRAITMSVVVATFAGPVSMPVTVIVTVMVAFTGFFSSPVPMLTVSKP